MRFAATMLVMIVLSLPAAEGHDFGQAAPGASVLRVLATTAHGGELSGSAVAIAADRFVTNCHVIRDARSIEIARGDRRWSARLRAGDGRKDLCILATPEPVVSSAIVISSDGIKPGDPVYAIGFPGGGAQVIATGGVEALFRFEGSKVIQTSAPFDTGSSGGALVNASGELVGLLTFKAAAGGPFHFAIPADWIAQVDVAGATGRLTNPSVAFYELEVGRRPHFLRAVWHQARENWRDLLGICEHWANIDPGNDEPRMLLIKTREHFRKTIPGL